MKLINRYLQVVRCEIMHKLTCVNNLYIGIYLNSLMLSMKVKAIL